MALIGGLLRLYWDSGATVAPPAGAPATGGSASGRGGGPDAELSLDDYLRKFGPRPAALPRYRRSKRRREEILLLHRL